MEKFNLVRKLLIVHEGVVLTEYLCTAGHRTIGVGFNLDANELPDSIKPKKVKGKLTITKEEADSLLDISMRDHWASLVDAFNWVASLDTVRQAAMLDLAFNMGIGTLKKFVNTMAFVSHGKYAEASKNLLQSKWAKQVQKQRVDTITEMIRTGVLTDSVKKIYGV